MNRLRRSRVDFFAPYICQMDTQLFIILLFVVIIILAIVTRKLSHTALIVALAANFMVICINYHNIKKQQREETRRDLTRVDAADEETFEEAPDSGGLPEETPDDEPPETIYGQDYVDWKRYDDTPIDVLPRTSSINDNVAARGLVDRTKRAITSNLLKDVDYYRYHFGKELDIEERKPWWGRYDK
jgi:hypothetical protein